MRLHKSYQATELKAVDGGDEGVFEALVSVFGNVDLAGDRVVKGAFDKSLGRWREAGDPIPIIWSHRWDDPKAHLGEVLEAEERDEGLWIRGQMDIGDHATYAPTVWRKMRRRLVKEFSFAYDVHSEKVAEDGANELLEIELLEVGPTLKGVNPDTQLLTVKAALPAHGSGTSDEPWDGPAAVAGLSNEAGAEVYREAFAWMDPDGDPDAKSSYRFIHHDIAGDGRVGPANLVACSSGIAVLNGGRGGTTIPEGDRRGVYNHLARHLRDGDREPPELRGQASDNPAAKAGRVLSAKNEQAIRQAVTLLSGVLRVLDEAADTTPSEEPAKAPAKPNGEEPVTRSPFSVSLIARST